MGESGPHRVRFEACPKRVRAFLGGHCVTDSTSVLYVWEIPHYPTYYFPTADVRAALIELSDASEHPLLGQTQYFDVAVDGTTASRAAKRYPHSPAPELQDHIRFAWNAMDEWLEEDELVYTHARDPHTRIDILSTSRHVQVMLDGVTLADSRRALILFETGLPPRYYMPLTDLRMDLLRRSDTTSSCPYKGTATYWSVHIGNTVYRDLVWMYRAPLLESQKIAGHAAFYSEKVDVCLDGKAI